jgi:hypothetical protein
MAVDREHASLIVDQQEPLTARFLEQRRGPRVLKVDDLLQSFGELAISESRRPVANS